MDLAAEALEGGDVAEDADLEEQVDLEEEDSEEVLLVTDLVKDIISLDL